MTADPPVSVIAVARVFLRLGCTAFGGPAAHLALMHEEVVRRRGWLSDTEFADLLGATNLIPGPNSTEMAIHVGRHVRGWPGLLVAGACFITPAALIVSGFAAAYVRYGSTPDGRSLLTGVAPVIVAIVFQALWRLGHATLRGPVAVVLAAAAAAAALAGMNELIVLVGAGLLAAVVRRAPAALMLALPSSIVVADAARGSAGSDVTLGGIAAFFLKVGSVLYGSGYVLVAFLRGDLVERWHWLTDQQLLDAVAVGQVTPGPVFTTATFIGYVLAGWRGAIVATLAIFAPAFAFVAVSQPLIPRLRRSAAASAFLDGVVAASLGLMAAVTMELARTALQSPWSLALAAGAASVLVRTTLNPTWLVLAGATIGLLMAR